jgi:7,8-dihydro-6-hydroxymethylpterin dimethyltransferase
MDAVISQESAVREKLQGKQLKTTKTRCVRCFVECDGEVWQIDRPGERSVVTMVHRCPVHGEHATLLSSDAEFYWLAAGDPGNSCCSVAPGGTAGLLGDNARNPSGIYETLSSCISLIEIVDSCNIACPTCFPGSPLGKHEEHLTYRPLAEIKERVEKVIAQKGEIEILQLSGGEPTLHPDLFELVRWAGAHEKIRYIFLNTNGIKFADEAFARGFEEAYPRGKLLLYLQFDGPQQEGQVELRGMDLRRLRTKVIARAAVMNLAVILVMTVTKDNLPFVYQTVEFGLEHRNVRAAHFQPVFMSGRTPATWTIAHERPITSADVIHKLMDGSQGLLGTGDFTPLPCGDPNCHVMSGALRPLGQPLIPLGRLVKPELLGAVANKVHYELSDLIACGCDNTPLGDALKALALGEDDAFAISIKPFMDARTWDKDRTDRCCTHVITPHGTLESFCRYYSGFSDTQATSAV